MFLAASQLPVEAGWYEFWHRKHLDFYRNNAWPEPFSSIDRKAQVAPFAMMHHKGWLRQNTIGHHHFDPTTQQLTEAGQLKLRWILTQTPADRRIVVVVRGYTDDETSMRADSVQQAAERIIPEGTLPEVRLTDIDARGWSADEIDAIDQKAKASIPNPVLPAMQSTTGGGP
jgi:hypothetical protein